MTKNSENAKEKSQFQADEAAVETQAETFADTAAQDDEDDIVEMEAVEVEDEAGLDEADESASSEGDEAASPDQRDASLAALTEERDALVAEREAFKEQLLRARAEFDNYRKRVLREGEAQRKRAAEQLLRDLLPVLDNLERALAHGEESGGEQLVEGVKMVHKQFLGVLDNYSVTPIVAVGEPFDPNLHDAMTQQPSPEYAEGVVMDEFERGYMIGDSVLRPSRVLVSSGAPEPEPEVLVEEVNETDESNDTAASEEMK